MTGRYKTTLWFGLLALAVAAGGCTAFADAVEDGGGGFDGGVGLLIEPVEYIRQGQKANYTIQFTEPPPWSEEPAVDSECGLTKLRFVELDHPDDQLLDIDKVTDYCVDSICEGCDVDTIGALLQATPGADTKVNRLLIWEVYYSEFGKPQKLWRGSARFWVFPDNDAQDLDGGSDGADGGGDPQ